MKKKKEKVTTTEKDMNSKKMERLLKNSREISFKIRKNIEPIENDYFMPYSYHNRITSLLMYDDKKYNIILKQICESNVMNYYIYKYELYLNGEKILLPLNYIKELYEYAIDNETLVKYENMLDDI